MVVIVIEIINEFVLKVFHGLKILQIEQFALEQTKEILYNSIIKIVTFPAHTLLNAFLSEHPLVLFMLASLDQNGESDLCGLELFEKPCSAWLSSYSEPDAPK